MNRIETQERDHYIDIVRGLASLSIIVIHTAFWSGESYVPQYFKSLTLLFDVPAFFFISGLSRGLLKRDNLVPSSFKLIAVFCLIAFVYSLLFDRSFKPFIEAITINAPEMPRIMTVTGSYWFVQVCIAVIFLGAIVLSKMKRIAPFLPALGFLYFVLSYLYGFAANGGTLGANNNFIIFYGSLYLFGVFCYDNIDNKTFRRVASLLLFATGAVVCLAIMINHGPIRMQDQKFPAQFPYVAASLLSVAAILFFHKRSARNAFLERIGKNALYYYGAQGIGASVASIMASSVTTAVWQIKFAILLTVNVLVTFVFAEILKVAFEMLFGDGKRSAVVQTNQPAV
jgi:fucose 4-O-acetylase-like acetyltransferase